MHIPFASKKSNHLALSGILLAVICSKTSPIFSKILIADGWTPLSLYFLVLLIMTIFMAVHELMALERGKRWGMERCDILGTVMTAVTGGVLSPILFFTGLQYVQASEAVLITSILPFFIVCFAVLFLKEKFNSSMIAGSIFLIAGTISLLWNDIISADISIGVPILLGSSFFSALTTTLHKKYVKHRHLDSIVFVRLLISIAIVGLLMLIIEPSGFTMLAEPQNIWLVLGLSVISFLMPYFLYFTSLRSLSTLDAGLVVTAGPGIGLVMASSFLGEIITPEQLLSMALIVFGILFINVPLTKIRIMPSRLMEMGPLRK